MKLTSVGIRTERCNANLRLMIITAEQSLSGAEQLGRSHPRLSLIGHRKGWTPKRSDAWASFFFGFKKKEYKRIYRRASVGTL